MQISVRPLSIDDLHRAADVLGEAFADYPWTNWCVAEVSHVERVAALQRIYLEHLALPFGRSYIDDSGNGVVAVLPPDTPEPDEATVEKIVELHGDRFERVLQADEQLSALPVPEHAWSLATIGTTPRSRGTGLGSALLQHALGELDRSGYPCWLDTSTERNLPLYQRFGFTIAGEISLTDGPTVWRMHRVQS
ncbi:GNAT family N-acetyltransferase [Rhodococcus sp. IEGM 1409]|uniref:GNAT family N-acetyltransferase n=1 Tax=Rhodococcus sp. IEGM 1409 TaxID=3047082 RepID=UPI0024B71079|nr:GNAT family N-acetyltransferase [Rhodococcus sp. IEGM 1409]MDI9899302.1 GNAT family N-acetyltransferase [Rhodococcus sp. IEGM 1409]